MTQFSYSEAAPRRKTDHLAERTGLGIPTISEPATDHTALTRGGAEIYRRIHRPPSTCNRIAELAGIGQTMEAR